MKNVLCTLLLTMFSVVAANAGVIDTAQKTDAQTWSAWGGEIGMHWNTDLLGNLGMTLSKPADGIANGYIPDRKWFAVRESGGLDFLVRSQSLLRFDGGSLQMRGGYELALRDGSHLDLRNMTVRVRKDQPRILDVFGADGKAWFYVNNVMFELIDHDHTLAVRTADIRITPQLARRLGAPEAANWAIADLAINAQVYVQGADVGPARECTPDPWPGIAVPGAVGSRYQADLFMESFDFQFMRCRECDGPGGSHDGEVVFAPDSSLKNNENDGSEVATIPGDPLGTSNVLYTANVAWYEMFSGSPPAYNQPYKNDQHPFLIWNIYRINADGSIEQIGRSGVKHAFLTINASCADSCHDSHALGRGCSDTYSTYNNDESYRLGPRSEIVPAKGIWGRCGSIWDPDCTGNGDPYSNGNDDYDDHLITRESQLDAGINPGATYQIESWYIARDDVNILNSMATKDAVPHYNSGSQSWSLNNQSNYRLGPAIDRWVDAADPGPNAASSELSNTDGHAKLAVKVTDLGGGSWRYDYAVMNLDYARAVTEGADNGPDPRVISNRGFDSFSVPVPGGASAHVSAMNFRDGDLDDSDDWTANTAGGKVTWTAPAGLSLDWGTLYSFSVTVNAAPVAGSGDLHVAESGTPASYALDTLVPTPADPADIVFRSGFDTP